MVDRTLAYAGRPVGSAVEVGAGTGKATRAFASRGVQVVALEPDTGDVRRPGARDGRDACDTGRLSAFEAYDGPPADLVYAAAAWHWTDPATRWTHAADLLEPGGVLSIFGSQLRIADPDLQQAVSRAIADDARRLGVPAEGDEGSARVGWRFEDIEESGLFAEVESHDLAREVTVSQKEYVGHLTTISAFLLLTIEGRQRRAAPGLRAGPGAGAARRCRSPSSSPVVADPRQSARSTITGAWSLAPLPARSSRSISAPVTRVAKAGEPSTKSMRIPRLRSKRCR